MIEREFIAQKTKEYYLKRYVASILKNVGISQIRLKKIPLGEKIIIYTSRPSLVVGSKGANIKELTKVLKKEFKLENPQVEINEVKNPYLDAQLVAEKVASSLERFGSARFKSVGHKVMENVINSGALGVELIISGKIPGARAKSWRFYQGYLKKCGDVALTGVQHAQATALLKSGMLGVRVSIMPPDVALPDAIKVHAEGIKIENAVPSVSDEEAQKKTKKKSAAKRVRKRSAAPTAEKKKEANATTEKKKAAKKEGRIEGEEESRHIVLPQSSGPEGTETAAGPAASTDESRSADDSASSPAGSPVSSSTGGAV